ncbi:MAG: hypothetical protein BGO77_01845 [Caedibacter sp. 37-49]|nr:MAG: hypothetical protein BGO77_01845 [Caedibacter sp. 37-49]
MMEKKKFIKKLENDFQIFDTRVSYISRVIEQESARKNSSLKKLNSVKSNLQEAFDIYKKLKLSSEQDWAVLRPFATKVFYQITRELSKLVQDIRRTNKTHAP